MGISRDNRRIDSSGPPYITTDARSGRQATDVLLKDFAGIAPGWDEWLVEQSAIARLARATLTPPDTPGFVH